MPDVYVKENYLEVEIPADGNMKAVRIDPADRSCVVKICQLDLNGEPIPLQKKYFETNGKTIRNGCYVFATQDPNLVIKFLGLPVRGKMSLWPNGSLTHIPGDGCRCGGSGKTDFLMVIR